MRLANPNADESSPYAEEGTRAHELCERLLLNPDLPEPGDDIDMMEDTEMLRHALRYRDYCLNVGGDGAITGVEQRVKMPAIHKKCYGTADYFAYIPEYRHLHCIDLKYGAGQYVEVEENPQAMMYAEGVRQWLYDEHGISPRYYTVHIFQPRLMQGENIASYQFTAARLNDFVHETSLEAKATEYDIDKFVPGDKQCHWCLANPCRARQAQMHEMLAGEFDDLDDAIDDLKETSPLMSEDEIAAWLSKAEALKKFISSIEAMAYERAMNHTPIPGFKLVEGRGSYKPRPEALEFILGDEIYQPRKVRSMTDLKKHLGVTKFNEVAAPYYKRQPGKPTLVPEQDNRPEWSETGDIDAMLEDL